MHDQAGTFPRLRPAFVSDGGSPSMKRPSTSHREECHYRDCCSDKPKKHIDQVNPHSVLHPLDTSVQGPCMNVNFSKDPKDSYPQDASCRLISIIYPGCECPCAEGRLTRGSDPSQRPTSSSPWVTRTLDK